MTLYDPVGGGDVDVQVIFKVSGGDMPTAIPFGIDRRGVLFDCSSAGCC